MPFFPVVTVKVKVDVGTRLYLDFDIGLGGGPWNNRVSCLRPHLAKDAVLFVPIVQHISNKTTLTYTLTIHGIKHQSAPCWEEEEPYIYRQTSETETRSANGRHTCGHPCCRGQDTADVQTPEETTGRLNADATYCPGFQRQAMRNCKTSRRIERESRENRRKSRSVTALGVRQNTSRRLYIKTTEDDGEERPIY